MRRNNPTERRRSLTSSLRRRKKPIKRWTMRPSTVKLRRLKSLRTHSKLSRRKLKPLPSMSKRMLAQPSSYRKKLHPSVKSWGQSAIKSTVSTLCGIWRTKCRTGWEATSCTWWPYAMSSSPSRLPSCRSAATQATESALQSLRRPSIETKVELSRWWLVKFHKLYK